MLWFFIFIGLFLIFFLINRFQQAKILSLFKKNNVLVSGLRGRGKDVLFSFVVNRRKQNYISNICYSSPKARYKCFPFSKELFEIGGNTYRNLTNNNVIPYTYPLPDGLDFYISDAGVYYPSQYATELIKQYPSTPLFYALSRHIADCNVHANSQAQGRIWDKLREQSDKYVVLNRTLFIPHTRIYYTSISVYDNAESAEKLLKMPYFGIGKKAREARNNFFIAHGTIKKIRYISILKYKFDSRAFKTILENNQKDYNRTSI